MEPGAEWDGAVALLSGASGCAKWGQGSRGKDQGSRGTGSSLHVHRTLHRSEFPEYYGLRCCSCLCSSKRRYDACPSIQNKPPQSQGIGATNDVILNNQGRHPLRSFAIMIPGLECCLGWNRDHNPPWRSFINGIAFPGRKPVWRYGQGCCGC